MFHQQLIFCKQNHFNFPELNFQTFNIKHIITSLDWTPLEMVLETKYSKNYFYAVRLFSTLQEDVYLVLDLDYMPSDYQCHYCCNFDFKSLIIGCIYVKNSLY
jgi:hypothetical protein